jgi:hypothetical protein
VMTMSNGRYNATTDALRTRQHQDRAWRPLGPRLQEHCGPCHVSGRGDPPQSLRQGALLCDVSSTVSSWSGSSVCPR